MGQDAIAKMPSAQIHMRLARHPVRAQTAGEVGKDSRRAPRVSNLRVHNAPSRSAFLFYFSFIFEGREISCCRRVRDMQEFFYFVICDSVFRVQHFQNLVELLSLSVLFRNVRLHEQVARVLRW